MISLPNFFYMTTHGTYIFYYNMEKEEVKIVWPIKYKILTEPTRTKANNIRI